MALNTDTSRAARSPIARRQLVDAVLAAPAHEQELDWIEWKSPPDVRAHRGAIARQILAFANREVRRAAQTAEGCGYLILGAAPGGNLVGVPQVDFGDLSNMLDPYVGHADGPQWDPDYVDVGGRLVLLITVAAPRDGDRPWPLRRQWNTGSGQVLQEGTIFTRRTGQAAQANAAEQDMLLARSRATARRLNISVRRSDAAMLRAVDTSVPAIEGWVAKERERLLRPIVRPSTGTVEVQPLDRAISKMLAGAMFRAEPEDRTEDQYRDEVESYLRRAAAQLRRHARWKAVAMRLAVLRLDVANLTEAPFTRLQVEVHVPGAVRAFWSSEDARPQDELPGPPRLWGPQPNPFGNLLGGASLPYLTGYSLAPMSYPARGWIKNSGSAAITFLPFDLRPQEVAELDEVFLAADAELAGEAISATWEATSTAANGRNAGAIDILFAPDLVALDVVLDAEDSHVADSNEDE